MNIVVWAGDAFALIIDEKSIRTDSAEEAIATIDAPLLPNGACAPLWVLARRAGIATAEIISKCAGRTCCASRAPLVRGIVSSRATQTCLALTLSGISPPCTDETLLSAGKAGVVSSRTLFACWKCSLRKSTCCAG